MKSKELKEIQELEGEIGRLQEIILEEESKEKIKQELMEELKEATYKPKPLPSLPVSNYESVKDLKVQKKVWRPKKKSKLEKPNFVAVLYLRESGTAEELVLESKKGFFQFNGKTYHENEDCTYTLGKKRYPLAIIPEWSVTPVGKREWEEKQMQEKLARLQDHVMNGIRNAERVRMGEKDKMQLNPKTLIVFGIIAIVAVAVIMNYV